MKVGYETYLSYSSTSSSRNSIRSESLQKKRKKKKKRKKEPELHRNTSKTKIMSTYFGIQLTMKSWNASVYSSSTWEQTGVEYGTKYSRMDQVKFVENTL